VVAGPPQKRASLALLLMWSLWIVVLFDPLWLLAAYGLAPLLKLRLVLFAVTALALIASCIFVPSVAKRFQWAAPMLAFITIGLVNLPFVLNRGMAFAELQQYLLYWSLMIATVALIDHARRAEKLMMMYCVAFIWFGLWGARAGMVQWHTVLSNFDGYGAFMVIGLGMCAFLAIAAGKGWRRTLMIIGAALCIVGVVSSFARGAFLAAMAIFGLVFFRSPHKLRTIGAGIGGVIILIAAAEILHPGMFWAEVQSVFAQGTEGGTGEDRWELWKAATKVWLQNPILGAGNNNWGVFAAEYFAPGEVGGRYADNPGRLYDRSLHSLYFSTLSEEGIVGIFVFAWIVVDFWKRNARLRTQAAEARWRAIGGRFKLTAMAFALECGMVGFLMVAAMYSTAGKHWFFTLLALNLTLYSLVFGKSTRRKPPRPSQAPVAPVPPPATPVYR
jgi:O-antigen ligase